MFSGSKSRRGEVKRVKSGIDFTSACTLILVTDLNFLIARELIPGLNGYPDVVRDSCGSSGHRGRLAVLIPHVVGFREKVLLSR